jgi:hypothetical protein
MDKLFGELLFGLVRVLVEEWLKEAGLKFSTWLDTKFTDGPRRSS